MRSMSNCTILLFIITLCIPMQAWADNVGDVVSVRGNAFVERKNKNIEAKINLAILEKDSILTGDKSRVKILFRDDSILTLGPMSRLVIRQYLYNSKDRRSDSIYDLLDGKLRAVVGSPGFKVRTPTAFAAARGTVFLVRYDSKAGLTKIAVIEGEVMVKNIDSGVGGKQTLTMGQMTSVSTGKPPTVPTPFNVESIDNLPVTEMPKIQATVVHEVDSFGRLVFQPPINQEPETKMTTPVTVELNFPQ